MLFLIFIPLLLSLTSCLLSLFIYQAEDTVSQCSIIHSASNLFITTENMRRSTIPAFGDWNNTNEHNITQYFESVHDQCWIEEEHDHDRFYASPTVTPNFASNQRNVKGNGKEKQQVKKSRRMSGGAVNPVDEDLYKIPPELLHQKSKKKRRMKSLWSGCMRLSCIA